ncbi:SLC13 family permease [Erythrobacter westpacificensis]|uniref:SLC13 family permease n=1 Tax=Erythrobacter westpacificensis TaxID=1055231 RepID=A0ABP9KSR6_9SPHN
MSIHYFGTAALVVVFVLGTVRPVNLGALALIATYLIGTLFAGESSRELLAGFPADLFVLLVGVTYLFGIAASNGTIEWIIDHAVRRIGDRAATIPWLIFGVAAIPSTAGALGPAAVAMLAPICLSLGERYGIDRRMTALMVMHGSAVGNFSPLNGLAIIVTSAAETNGLAIPAFTLFFGNAVYNIGLAVVIYLMFGGPALLARRRNQTGQTATLTVSGGPSATSAMTGGAPVETPKDSALRTDQIITLLAILGVGVGALVYNIDIGFLALIAAAFLHLCFPSRVSKVDRRIVWSVVLLICGVVTFVGALQRYGTVDLIGNEIAGLGSPLLIAFLLCLLGAVTSAVASSAGMLGVLIPLAVPFMAMGQIHVAGMIVALAISSTVVDSTPFSTVGALTLATAPEEERPELFQAMLKWGIAMALTAPVLTCLFFLLPDWG